MRSRLDGLEAVLSTFDALPQEARDELAVEIGIISREISAAQKDDVPQDTGALRAALTFELQLERLRSRIGLLKKGRSRTFYGRIVEKGRKAQVVLVTRRLKRKVSGFGRKRKITYQGKPYKLRVRAMAARPFVAQPMLQDVAQRHLSEYASRLLGRVGAR